MRVTVLWATVCHGLHLRLLIDLKRCHRLTIYLGIKSAVSSAWFNKAMMLNTIRNVEVRIQTKALSSLSLYFSLPLLLNLY